jgi:hypothetical protein
VPAIEFPRQHLALLQELASRVIESRALGCDAETLARDLFAGFHDVCMRSGLDRVLVELEQAFPPLDITDRFALCEHPDLRPALVTVIGDKLDDGGPRNAKPLQLAECLVTTLSLALFDEADRTITLGDDVRTQVLAALTSVIDVEFAIPQIRETIIAKGRQLCEARYHGAYDKITAQLDDRGMKMIRQPKVPLDAVQAVQQVLFDARYAVIERAARAAIDGAKQALARADANAAARIDLPITHRLTPRDVAIQRACESRVPKMPATIVQSLFESLTELCCLAWRPLERLVRSYAATQTFAVGDLLDHPKFGRGSVLSSDAQRIEVEFADGPHTLVHMRPSK